MFDITRYITFENLSNWFAVFKKANENHNQKVPALLVGSKTDLKGMRTVPTKEAISFAQDNDFVGYIECSSKNGENVEELFRKITKIMMEKVK
jgi:Ras-related protein Rab-11A